MPSAALSAEDRVAWAKRWRHDLGKSVALWSANLSPEQWADTTCDALAQALTQDLLTPRKDGEGRVQSIVAIYDALRAATPAELAHEINRLAANMQELGQMLRGVSVLEKTWIVEYAPRIRQIQLEIRQQLSQWVAQELATSQGSGK